MSEQQPLDAPDDASFDVIVSGVYFYDMIFTGLPQMPELGKEIFGSGFDVLPGGSYNTVIALHKLGLSVGWSCEFGNDSFSEYVLAMTKQHGIDDRLFRLRDEPWINLTVSLSFADDRAFVTYTSAYTPLQLPDVATHPTRCLLVSVLYTGDDLPLVSAEVRENGGVVFMDCSETDATLDTPGVRDTLGAVDIFAPNEKEALSITRAHTLDAALDQLATLVPTVIIKQGPDGALARHEGRTVHVPALPVDVVDTTGAGDCFNAGFLYGYLRGEPLERCLRLGNIVGGLSTTGRGTTKVPSADAVERYLQDTP